MFRIIYRKSLKLQKLAKINHEFITNVVGRPYSSAKSSHHDGKFVRSAAGFE
jgi:hypothetical protein